MQVRCELIRQKPGRCLSDRLEVELRGVERRCGRRSGERLGCDVVQERRSGTEDARLALVGDEQLRLHLESEEISRCRLVRLRESWGSASRGGGRGPWAARVIATCSSWGRRSLRQLRFELGNSSTQSVDESFGWRSGKEGK